ncbi:MAG: DUF4190 domain-containing protein [Clostridia bacterium]|nr:DUF4190 domain-containing protein [Clostridia bacterium]
MEEDKKEIIEIENVKKEETNTKVIQEPKKDKKGFCIASMVLGIVSLVFFCAWYISIPCAILAIIFGILGIKTPTKGMAIAGLVTGSIGFVVSIAIIIFLVIFGVAMGITESINDDYNSTYRNHRNYRNYNWYDFD